MGDTAGRRRRGGRIGHALSVAESARQSPTASSRQRAFKKSLVHLVGRHAGRRLEAANLVDADAIIADARGDALKNVTRQIFRRRIQLFVKGRKLVDVAMV